MRNNAIFVVAAFACHNVIGVWFYASTFGGDGLFSMETCFISEVNLKTPDINEDGCIDIYDSIKTAVRYGDEGESPADYNNDLIVDIYDVLILASHFGKCY